MSICLHWDIEVYFEFDLLHRQLYYLSPLRHKQIEYFLLFIPIFSTRLLYLLYFNGDSLVWEHLFDIIVRNLEQVKWCRSKKTQGIFWSILCQVCLFPKISKSSILLYYPNLKQKLRKKCIVIYFVFEVLTTIMSFFGFFITLITFCDMVVKAQLSAVQVLYSTFFLAAALPQIILFSVMIFLIMLTLYLVCYIYVNQYLEVNSKLAKVKVILQTENGGHQHYIFSSLKTSLAGNAYRTSHTRLTAFILHYNRTTVSKIVSAYLQCVLPVHAFCVVLVYFRGHDISLPFTIHLIVGAIFLWLVLMALTFVVARVNHKISLSGPILGEIFARKGVLAERRRQCNWFNSCESVWSREALKLSTYYEMIWRCDKELAFTAGHSATMNWMFIVDVSL